VASSIAVAAKRRRKTAVKTAAKRPPELPRALRPPPEVTRDLYLAWRSPRIGQGNPHRMTNHVWAWLARAHELSAYQANALFEGPSSMLVGPAWCNARFGQSTTTLPDGRTLRIGGEHEDHYDPDFFIYNDVQVEDGAGGVEIYGYAYDAFGPTDFHTASLVGDAIFVVGNLSYPARRRSGTTPVVRLDTKTLAFDAVPTAGTPPGWLSRHAAALSADGGAIVVSGGKLEAERDGAHVYVDSPDDWSLDLGTMRWSRLTDRRWEEWELRRADGKSNGLFDLDMAYTYWDEETPFGRRQLARLGDVERLRANRALHASRYSPPVPHETLPDSEDVPRVLRRVVDGVVVRYVEDSFSVRIVFEGLLPVDRVEAIVADACAKLGTLEGVRYASRRVATSS
jgi:hypothetical protein